MASTAKTDDKHQTDAATGTARVTEKKVDDGKLKALGLALDEFS